MHLALRALLVKLATSLASIDLYAVMIFVDLRKQVPFGMALSCIARAVLGVPRTIANGIGSNLVSQHQNCKRVVA